MRYTMAYARFCPEPKTIALAKYQIAYRPSDSDYVSGPLFRNRRGLVRYNKGASGFDKGKEDQFCLRNDKYGRWPQEMYYLCYFYKLVNCCKQQVVALERYPVRTKVKQKSSLFKFKEF